ncbi:MAG TPA: histidine kinase [Microlunatus sp.]|nr:histidine kinase [Microlunatus sp.]
MGDVAVVALALVMDLTAWAGDRAVRGGPMLPLLVVPVITVVVYASLLWRWRRPLAVYAVLWTYSFSCLLLPEFQPFAGLLLALHAVAVQLPARWSVAALALTAVPFSLYARITADLGSGGPPAAFAQVLVLWMLLAAAAWGVGRLSFVAARRSWRLQQLQAAQAAAAVREERLHLARELHDIVTHAVTAMLIQAAGAKAVLDEDPSAARRSLDVIETSGVQAMAELHRMLDLLRMAIPEGETAGPTATPGTDDLVALVTAAASAGRDVSLTEQGVPGPLDPSVATALYRVVQESLTNALKHGGPRAAVTIAVRWAPMVVEVEVSDVVDGEVAPGTRPAEWSSGRGLTGLAERVATVGGSLAWGPTATGFSVLARLPRPGVLVTPTLVRAADGAQARQRSGTATIRNGNHQERK